MKVLVFDTETTGLPTERNASILDVDKWPYVVQLSYILYDSDTKQLLKMTDTLIKLPGNVDISPGSEAIHHITRGMCEANGISINDALNGFNKALEQADVVVGHNLSFDKRMLMVESKRLNKMQKFTINGIRKPEYCTMKNSTDWCRIEVTAANGETYNKFPKLSELHYKLFDTLPRGTHNALADILICLRCYTKMVEAYDYVTDIVSPCRELQNMYLEYCV